MYIAMRSRIGVIPAVKCLSIYGERVDCSNSVRNEPNLKPFGKTAVESMQYQQITAWNAGTFVILPGNFSKWPLTLSNN